MRDRVILIVGLLLLAVNCTPSTAQRDGSEVAAKPRAADTISGNTESPSTGAATSVYTELSGGQCTAQKQTDIVSSERRCPGIQGYKLIVTNVDDRESITVVTPESRQFDLNFPNLICGASFGSVGQKAEWRVIQENQRSRPTALIVRVNCQSIDAPAKTVSYLSVSKITTNDICVTDRIQPTRDANVNARSAADSSATKPCRKSSDR